MSCTNSPLRRTKRTVKPTLKARESELVVKLKNSGFVELVSSDEDLSDEEFFNLDVQKPNVLHDNEIVHGEELFKFQSRKQKDSLAQKVADVCRQRTPHIVRNKTKSKLVKLLEEDSDSEYNISTDETTTSSSSGEDEENVSASDSDENNQPKAKTNKAQSIQTTLQPLKTRNKGKYLINTEEYFEHSSSNKIRTSNNTLDKLKTPRLPQYEVQKLLQNMKLSQTHENSIKQLSVTNEKCFNKWLYLLNENFNILLYGLGSKRDILTKFHKDYLKDMPVIVVNGFFPTLTIKNILDAIIVDLLVLEENPVNLNEACDLIIQEFNSIPETHLYLIIHNIDGEMIRSGKHQNVLARLAAVKNIHLIASIDHINAPLIWDHNKLSKFNYIWWDVTSFLPYTEETSFENSLMVQQTGTLALSSLRNVFLSLTPNSKIIYKIIVKHQLKNAKSQYYQGLAFKDLYEACRQAFVVSSDLALRAQLTEFIDHKMVKFKRSLDGTEYLMIPLTDTLLQKFIDDDL